MTLLSMAALLGMHGLAAFVWPRTATVLVVAVTMLWPAYIVIGGTAGPGVNPQRLMVPVSIMVWMLHLVAVPAFRRQLLGVLGSNRFLFLVIAAFFVLGIFSGVVSPFDRSQATWGSLNQVMFIPALMLLVVTYFRTPGSVERLLLVLVLIALVAQALGVVEWIRQEVVFRDFVAPGSEHAEKILEGKLRLERHRVTSVFDNPLSYAQYLVFVLPLVMYQLRRGVHPAWQALAWLQLALIPFSVWTTGSRTGMALVLFTYLAALLLWLGRARLSAELRGLGVTAVVGTVAVAVAFVALRVGAEGFLGGTKSIEASTAARVVQLAYGIPAIAQSPVYGVGVHQGTNYMGGLTSIDNYYLTVVLEKGITGLLLLVLLQVLVLLRLYRGARRLSGVRTRRFAALLFIGFLTLFLFQFTLSVVEVFTVSYIVLACFLLVERFDRRARAAPS